MTITESAGNAAPAQPVLAAHASENAYLAWIQHGDGATGLRLTTTMSREIH